MQISDTKNYKPSNKTKEQIKTILEISKLILLIKLYK